MQPAAHFLVTQCLKEFLRSTRWLIAFVVLASLCLITVFRTVEEQLVNSLGEPLSQSQWYSLVESEEESLLERRHKQRRLSVPSEKMAFSAPSWWRVGANRVRKELTTTGSLSNGVLTQPEERKTPPSHNTFGAQQRIQEETKLGGVSTDNSDAKDDEYDQVNHAANIMRLQEMIMLSRILGEQNTEGQPSVVFDSLPTAQQPAQGEKLSEATGPQCETFLKRPFGFFNKSMFPISIEFWRHAVAVPAGTLLDSAFGPQYVSPGGRWHPQDCTTKHHLAIIVPFRDRDRHLAMLLPHLHHLLQLRRLDYRIYVVEQSKEENPLNFNRGMLKNIGAHEALKDSAAERKAGGRGIDCVIFHDVDMLAQSADITYGCPNHGESPVRHLSPLTDELEYQLPYAVLIGGVLAMNTSSFIQANGYSNLYLGWGAEDDDLSLRLTKIKIAWSRDLNGMFDMVSHKKAIRGLFRRTLYENAVQRMYRDGYSSLKYTLLRRELKKLETRVLVELPTADLLNESILTAQAIIRARRQARERRTARRHSATRGTLSTLKQVPPGRT